MIAIPSPGTPMDIRISTIMGSGPWHTCCSDSSHNRNYDHKDLLRRVKLNAETFGKKQHRDPLIECGAHWGVPAGPLLFAVAALLILKVLECINNIKIYTIKSSIKNFLQIRRVVPIDNVLPILIPIMNLVITRPIRIFIV